MSSTTAGGDDGSDDDRSWLDRLVDLLWMLPWP